MLHAKFQDHRTFGSREEDLVCCNMGQGQRRFIVYI